MRIGPTDRKKVIVAHESQCEIAFIEGRLGNTPSMAGTFQRKFRKKSGKTPETLSERFLEFPSRVRLVSPKPYNSSNLRLPERFQNSLLFNTAGDTSFLRSGSGEGLSELVMEFPAVLTVFLNVHLLSPPVHCEIQVGLRFARFVCCAFHGAFTTSHDSDPYPDCIHFA